MYRRWNIVFLLNDHQAYYRHGWDGGPRIQRPNFDRLAGGGASFRRAYTACPLCGPARRTMLTGLYPHTHGEIKNDVNSPYRHPLYLDILGENGYRNFYYGKWHAGAGTAHEHHCEGFSYPSYNNPYTKPEYKEYLESRGLGEPEILIERKFHGSERIVEGQTYRQRRRWCNEHASGVMTTPDDTHEAFFLANMARDKLVELADEGGERPFHLRVDFWGPHQPYFPTRRFAEMYDPSEIPQYGSFRDTLDNKPEIYRFEMNQALRDENKRLIQPNPLPWEVWQKVLARCYAQITLIDAAGGIILDALEDLGLVENTLVIWASDHGDAVACHGGHFDKASYMPEEMVRVPLAVRMPGRIPPHGDRDELVSNLDIAPTILAAAWLDFGGEVHGRSLLGLFDGTAERREDLMFETHGHCQDHLGRGVVTRRHKYIANKGQTDELYDLQDDPYEMDNLIDKADGGLVDEMRCRLEQWQRNTGDNANVMD